MSGQRAAGEHLGFCPAHGKVLYDSRKRARRGMREHPGGQRMRPYPCNQVPGMWHVGHLPKAVRYGVRTAAEMYGGAP